MLRVSPCQGQGVEGTLHPCPDRSWVIGGHCWVTSARHRGAAPDVPEGLSSNVSSIFSQSFQHPLSSENAACSFECVIS